MSVSPQLFKGTFYHCIGPNLTDVTNKTNCLSNHPDNQWINQKYNFDDLGQALMSLFVLSSKDGWVNIMYQGLDSVGVDQQVNTSCLFNFSHPHFKFLSECSTWHLEPLEVLIFLFEEIEPVYLTRQQARPDIGSPHDVDVAALIT